MPYAVQDVLRQRRAPRATSPASSAPTPSRRRSTLAGLHAHAPSGVGDRVQPGVGPHRARAPPRTATGNPVGFRLRVWYWDKDAPNVPYDAGGRSTRARPAGPEPIATEDFDDLSVDPASPSYFVKRVNDGNSSFVEIAGGRRAAAGSARRPGVGAARRTASTTTRSPLPDFLGDDADPNERTGLAALELDRYRDVAIVYAPAAAARRRPGGHHPLRAQPVPLRRRRLAVRPGRTPAAIDPRDRRRTTAQYARVLLPVDLRQRPAQRRPQEDPAGRRGLRHLRPHRQHHAGCSRRRPTRWWPAPSTSSTTSTTGRRRC